MPETIKRATCHRCKETIEYRRGNPDGIEFGYNFRYKAKTWKCPNPKCGLTSAWTPKNVVVVGGNSDG